MAQFTKYYPGPDALEANPAFPATYRADFIGWDSPTQGAQATEATRAQDLGQRVNATTAAVFAKLNPGERICRDGIVYARD